MEPQAPKIVKQDKHKNCVYSSSDSILDNQGDCEIRAQKMSL